MKFESVFMIMSRFGSIHLISQYIQIRHKIDIPGSIRLVHRKLAVPINRFTKYQYDQPQPNIVTHIITQFWGQKLHGYNSSWGVNEPTIRWGYEITGLIWNIYMHPVRQFVHYETADYRLKSHSRNREFDIFYEQSSIHINIFIYTDRPSAVEAQHKWLTSEWSRYNFKYEAPDSNIVVRTLHVLKTLNYLNNHLPDWAVKMI